MREDRLREALSNAMRRRAGVVAAMFAVLCLGGLAVRLYYLQLVTGDWYKQKAAGQQLRDSIVPADRGLIYSSDGTLLASSETCWTIRAAPRELADELVSPTAKAMAEILQVEEADVLEKLSQRVSNDCLLKRRVDKATADAVRDWCAQNGAEGILILQDTRRVYPQGHFLGGVLGFTNVDNAGMSGLELKYNEQLTGTNGRVLTAKNAWGYNMPISYETAVAAVPGQTLTLTIDANIQRYLEKYLSVAVEEHNVAARAVGMVMDVNTGAILAMSCQPDYDPNQPRVLVNEAQRAAVEALSGEERSAALQTAQQQQWRNKAVSDLYEPGSVFKVVTSSAALDAGAVGLDSTFSCGSHIGVAGTTFHCANNRAHGLQNLSQCLANSCNCAFIQIGARLGKENFYRYFKAYGLCGATGIDLPAEPKKSEFYTDDRMGPVELASCSFGQSSKISYLQMLTAVCAAVNGGNRMQPYVVAQIADSEGKVLSTTRPVVKERVISEETSAKMRQMLEYVVTNGGGKNCYVAGYRVGGKSGTSQKLDSENEKARIASFVGVVPIDNPQIAVLVCLDEPHSWTTAGGILSAPVVANVIRDTLEYRGVEKQYTEKEKARQLTAVPDVTGWKPDAAQSRLLEAGLSARVQGTGERVTLQTPAAGTELPKNSTLILYTQQNPQPQTTIVPPLRGLSAEQVETVVRRAGLNLQLNDTASLPGTQAVSMSIPTGQRVAAGMLLRVWFAQTDCPEDD